MKKKFAGFFNKIAHQYHALSRYSVDILDYSLGIFSDALPNQSAHILDIGSGDGYPAVNLAKKNKELIFSLLDLSAEMINVAKINLGKNDISPFLIHGDINEITLSANMYDGVLSCCTLQFVIELNFFLENVYNSLRKNGVLCILFYEPEDLYVQLVHKYFPGFHEIEKKRHYDYTKVIDALQKNTYFSIIHLETIDYDIFYKNHSEYLDFIATKPFSGFALMSEKAFEKNFQTFESNIIKMFSGLSVNDKGKIKILVAKKI